MAPIKIYGLCNRAGDLKYIGSSRQSLKTRKRSHAAAARNGSVDCPLYRYCQEQQEDIRDWSIVCLVTLNITNQDVARQAEQHFIQLFQRGGTELLNTNRAIDPNVRRRNYSRAWRERNSTYMADYARERRRRLRTQDNCAPRRKYKLSIDNGQSWMEFKSTRQAADHLTEFGQPVSVTKLWRHVNPSEYDNVGPLVTGVLFEKVTDEQAEEDEQ